MERFNWTTHICTKGHPWKEGLANRCQHPDAKEISQTDGYPSGDVITLECPWCKTRFDEEVPK